MEFTNKTSANIFFGKGCVRQYAKQWILGKRAYIVTGKNSGRESGALQDVMALLCDFEVAYTVFEGIGNNPTLEECIQQAEQVRAFGADFILAIGGGSPLDAAKAIAVLALGDFSIEQLFQNEFAQALPVVAIPTTSGTGSEVTPWSILTRHDTNTKKSFGNACTMPAVALLDAKYTYSLPRHITLHTAMDAFTHCVESYLSKKSTPVTEALVLNALGRFGRCLDALEHDLFMDIREELMLISMLGGMAIANTGTTLMHGMGYPLTYYKGMPHGEANCAVMPSYFAFANTCAKDRLDTVFSALQTDVDTFCAFVRRSIPLRCTLTKAEISHYARQTMGQNSTQALPRPVIQADIEAIYRQEMGQKSG